MFYSALAYMLSGIAAFTIAMFLGIIVKMLSFFIASSVMGKEKMFQNMGSVLRPIEFISSIVHGYVSIPLALWIFGIFGVKVDFFIVVFLLIAFLWFDFIQMRRQREMFESGQLPPQLAMFGEAMREQMKAMLYNGAVIGMIGKATGVILAGVNHIGW